MNEREAWLFTHVRELESIVETLQEQLQFIQQRLDSVEEYQMEQMERAE